MYFELKSGKSLSFAASFSSSSLFFLISSIAFKFYSVSYYFFSSSNLEYFSSYFYFFHKSFAYFSSSCLCKRSRSSSHYFLFADYGFTPLCILSTISATFEGAAFFYQALNSLSISSKTEFHFAFSLSCLSFAY